jgi:serine/threonine protein kinase
MHRFLNVIAGPDKGKRYQISDAFTTMLGRSKHANTQVSDLSVSRVHCEVEIRNQKIFLTDLESGSGTFVNNQRVADCELRIGDVLRIGDTQMRVELPPGEIDEKTAQTLPLPVSLIPARPVLKTSARLNELTGNKLSHYDVGDVLAKGASGLVFKAHDFKNDRAVAFKVLWPEFSQNEDDMQRFVRAMKTMMPLRHPNLVSLYGAGKTGPYCWIAMELVAGESLTQVISRVGAANMLDWKRVLQISYYLAKALEYAHSKSVIHRNLTPQNVMIGKTPDQTKLGDLMLAKAQEGGLAQQITKPGEVLGDVRYMSPERTGAGAVDERSDLYGLGALSYALLTGRPPHDGFNQIEIMTKIRKEEPARPKKFQMAIPDPIEGMVMRLLSKSADKRFESAAVLLKELQRLAKWHSVSL